MKFLLSDWWAGCQDSVGFYHTCFPVLLQDSDISKRFAKIVIINMFLFYLPYLLYQKGIPFVLVLFQIYSNVYITLIQYFLLIPLAILVHFLNLHYHLELVRTCKKKLNQYVEEKKIPLSIHLSYTIFYQICFAIVHLQIVFFSNLNWIGWIVSSFIQTLFYTYYLYDYRCWVFDSSLTNRVQRFEQRWLYFLGYGTLFLLPNVFSFYERMLCIHLLFPFLLLHSFLHDMTPPSHSCWYPSFPFLSISKYIVDKFGVDLYKWSIRSK